MKSIHFLCSPSLGILDSWLPILAELKKKEPGINFVLLIPKAGIVEHISDADITIQIAKTIFNEVLFVTHDGSWKRVDRIEDAVRINSTLR